MQYPMVFEVRFIQSRFCQSHSERITNNTANNKRLVMDTQEGLSSLHSLIWPAGTPVVEDR